MVDRTNVVGRNSLAIGSGLRTQCQWPGDIAALRSGPMITLWRMLASRSWRASPRRAAGEYSQDAPATFGPWRG